MQTTHNFVDFCNKYNYDFDDEINSFKELNNLEHIDPSDLEVRVYDSGNDVDVSIHYFAGYDTGFKYTQPDGYVEVCNTIMPDAQNEDFLRRVVNDLLA